MGVIVNVLVFEGLSVLNGDDGDSTGDLVLVIDGECGGLLGGVGGFNSACDPVYAG